MNNIYKLLWIILIFTAGCKSTDLNKERLNQVIDNFNMDIFSNEGTNRDF